MAIIRNLVVKVTADITQLQKSLSNAQKSLDKASAAIGNAGATLTKTVTAPVVALGALSVKTAAQFEQSMANAASVSGATGEEFEKMKEIAREMGKTTVFSASEAADAMYYMASAGYKVEEMGNSIKPILDLAAATQTDLASSTDTVISTLNQFGLESKDAGRVANVFAAAIANSQATMDKLTYSMRYVGPVANSLGYSLEETTAALSALYDAGFQGEQAGTILRSALSRLLKPTAEMTTAAKALGISMEALDPKANSLADILKTLEGTSIDATTAVQLFGVEAGPGMLALLQQGSGKLAELTGNITGTEKAAETAAKQTNTFQGKLKLLNSAFEELQISIGEKVIPILTKLLNQYIKPLIDKFNSLTDAEQEAIVKNVALAAAIGPLLMVISQLASGLSSVMGLIKGGAGLIGKLTSALGGLSGGASGAAGALGGVKTALGAITAPVAAVIAAVLTGVGAFITLWNTSDEFRDGILSSMADVEKAVVNCFNSIGIKAEDLNDVWQAIIGSIQGAWMLFCGIIGPAISTAINQVCIILESAFKIIGGLFDVFGGLFTADWERMWNGIVGIFDGIFGGIVKTVENVFSGIVNTCKGVLDWLGGFFNWGGNTTVEVKVPDNIATTTPAPIGGYMGASAAARYGPLANPVGTSPVGGVNINIQDNTFGSPQDIDEVGSRLAGKLRTAGVVQ